VKIPKGTLAKVRSGAFIKIQIQESVPDHKIEVANLYGKRYQDTVKYINYLDAQHISCVYVNSDTFIDDVKFFLGLH